jgi:D-alanyl-lipoteichoic acid acyltransferase DltB (MBOAT superfamily)
MLFPTPEFALFFAVVFTLSWGFAAFPGARKKILLLGSYFFYGFWDWRFTFLLFGSSFINYILALAIDSTDHRGFRRFWLVLAVTMDLGILFFFKYYGFFMNSVNNLVFFLGQAEPLPIMNVILPVGISFFTFQALSYVVDVYRREIEASGSLGDVLLYIAFFPQLVAGPIVRASVFMPQLTYPPDPQRIPGSWGLTRIMIGLFKKVVMANYLAVLLVDPVFLTPRSYSPLEVLLAAYGYAFQIFCDFSAYSDIAIGVAALLGYHFPENFNQPYRADSFQDFWRRWHISLSTWLRDYLYIPLGGSRKGSAKTYRNLLITMLLGGMWHGAAWNFILWGALHGTALGLERALTRGKPRGGMSRFFRGFLVFHFVTFCWIFFRSPDLAAAGAYIQALGGEVPFQGILTPFILGLLILGLALHFLPPGLADRVARITGFLPWPIQGILLGSLFLGLQILSPRGMAPFIYFQF